MGVAVAAEPMSGDAAGAAVGVADGVPSRGTVAVGPAAGVSVVAPGEPAGIRSAVASGVAVPSSGIAVRVAGTSVAVVGSSAQAANAIVANNAANRYCFTS